MDPVTGGRKFLPVPGKWEGKGTILKDARLVQESLTGAGVVGPNSEGREMSHPSAFLPHLK